MVKSQQSFNKKEKETNRAKKQKDKQQKKEERKRNPTDGSLANMTAYVDEYGMITDTPPDPAKKLKVNAGSIEIGVPKRDKDDAPALRVGKVEFFNDTKGFGFIKEQGTQEKYFVHANGLIDEISENDTVTFELERGAKGMNAVRVRRM